MMVAVADRADVEGGEGDALPPLAGEDHVCDLCGLSYPQLSIAHATDFIRSVPRSARQAVAATPSSARRLRPAPDAWSVTEYVCHLRDVYATYTVRLHRVRTEDWPALEPMLNDLRVRRFRYNERDIEAVLDELAATAAGFCEEVGHTRPDEWERLGSRLPGEQRTARWLVRQAMHEGQHHLADIRRTGDAVIGPSPGDWAAWLASWDHQQEQLLADREERFAVMLDVIEAVVGNPRQVLDLACGPGSIAVRLLRRFQDAGSTLVDVDPALLAIAEGVLGGDSRVRIIRANLADPGWVRVLPAGSYDAVLTASSLHWLDEPTLRRVYGDLAGVIRPGGVMCNTDLMPPDGVDQIAAALGRQIPDPQAHQGQGDVIWEDWWRMAAADATLAPLVVERTKQFGGATHPPEFSPPLTWHAEALRDAGFAEAGCVWRNGAGAVLAALR